MEGQSQGMTAELREQSARAGEAVQQKAVELKHEGRETLRQQLDQRTTQVGEQTRTLAQTMRRTGGELRSQQGDGAASRVAVGAADRLDRVGEYLENASGDQLLRDAERFARERPWVVAGMAAAAGFAASRFLKASSERRYQSQGNGFHYTSSWERAEPVGASRGAVVEPGR